MKTFLFELEQQLKDKIALVEEYTISESITSFNEEESHTLRLILADIKHTFRKILRMHRLAKECLVERTKTVEEAIKVLLISYDPICIHECKLASTIEEPLQRSYLIEELTRLKSEIE